LITNETFEKPAAFKVKAPLIVPTEITFRPFCVALIVAGAVPNVWFAADPARFEEAAVAAAAAEVSRVGSTVLPPENVIPGAVLLALNVKRLPAALGLPLVLTATPLPSPRFAELALATLFAVIPWVLPPVIVKEPPGVIRTAKLVGPAGPRPKSSANAEQPQNKTSSRTVIPTSVAPQEAGLRYERPLPDRWSVWTADRANKSRGIGKTAEIKRWERSLGG
jgi:hypothetical protein